MTYYKYRVYPEEQPLPDFVKSLTNNIVNTVLNNNLYTALLTTTCTVLNTTVCTVLYTVPYTILYTDAKSGITKFIAFLIEHSTVNVFQYPSL